MLILLGVTLSVSAFLLFCCEPMVGKMVLPILGGAASVWTTCVVFFQIMLLAGYTYAHFIGKLKRLAHQILIHIVLMSVALALLPIRFGDISGHPSTSPVTWLLVHLFLSAGIPFAVISATAPLVQNWLARTTEASARDPYFLYAASNGGSLLALLAYPILIEPKYGVSLQSRLWLDGYGALLAIMAFSAVLIWAETRHVKRDESNSMDNPQAAVAPSWKLRVYWLAAAFVPSALMLAVTNHISFNVGSVPLLWVIPLAVYLVTFILAFARTIRIATAIVSSIATLALLAFFPIVAAGSYIQPNAIWKLVTLHVAILFVAALLCHSSLADRRPAAKHLTQFYFMVALGGVLGGIFTAIVAPAFFKTVFEYPLLIAAVPLFRGARGRKPAAWTDAARLMSFAVLVVVALYGLIGRAGIDVTAFALPWEDLGARANRIALATQIVLVLIALLFRNRKVVFGIAFAILVLGYGLVLPRLETWTPVFAARNFFGVKRVLLDKTDNMLRLLHGDTIHGVESLEAGFAGEPLGYYHRTGALGDVMSMLESRSGGHVGVVGLGAGTIAAYGGPSRRVTFFEIDPQVLDVARDYFSFLRRCGPYCDVTIGDGRLLVEAQRDGEFDLLVLDAFNSDSVPAHLVSREAIRMYAAKLNSGGILLVHVPNRYLDIDRLVVTVALGEGLVPFARQDFVAVVRRREDFLAVPNRESWKHVDKAFDIQPWTDDYSNLLSLIRWD